jgi:hypothetical protein
MLFLIFFLFFHVNAESTAVKTREQLAWSEPWDNPYNTIQFVKVGDHCMNFTCMSGFVCVIAATTRVVYETPQWCDFMTSTCDYKFKRTTGVFYFRDTRIFRTAPTTT